jgi:aryl-alcohol dehydrogenase-like predicted oxidoreductase
MFAWQFCTALHVSRRNGWTPFATMQNHYNLLYREEEREMLPLCAAEGIGVIPWSPLARGRLTRAWDDVTERIQTDEYGKTLYVGTIEADRQVVERVAQVAAARGVPRAQIALAWLLHQGVVTAPIVGVSKPHHLDDAVAALSLKLTAEETSALEGPYVPHRVVGLE